MISGKTTLTSFGLRSWIVNLSLAYPASGWIFLSCTNMSKNYSPFIVVEGAVLETAAHPTFAELHHRFRLFPSVNIHCFRSLFKTSDPRGWLEIILK
jgi:hypothetical protein